MTDKEKASAGTLAGNFGESQNSSTEKLYQKNEKKSNRISNRRLKYRNPYISPKKQKIKWSIDRITLSGNFAGGTFLTSKMAFRKFADFGSVKEIGTGFQLLDNWDENLAYFSKNPFRDSARLDFNPNKVEDLAELPLREFVHAALESPHYTRVDVACDLFNYDDKFVNSYTIVDATGEKFWLGKGKNLETHYFGSQASEKQVRLYNKLVEQRAKKTDIPPDIKSWWRWEASDVKVQASLRRLSLKNLTNSFPLS